VRRRRDREAEGVFVVEGHKLVRDAFAAGADVEAVYVAPQAAAEFPEARVLAEGVLERISDTVTPQGVLAVVRRPSVTLEEAVAGAELVVVGVDLQDPGNLGTVVRSAEAAGVDAVVCCGDSVDAFAPKSVRASAGSLFHVPVVNEGDPVAVLDQLGAWGVRRLGTVARGGTAYDEADLTVPTALVLGNEAHGLPPAVEAALDDRLTIPMAGRSESLNVGMAASVLCFEAARQRRAAGR
jgi:RNA methyltransferase, TrmH family